MPDKLYNLIIDVVVALFIREQKQIKKRRNIGKRDKEKKIKYIKRRCLIIIMISIIILAKMLS